MTALLTLLLKLQVNFATISSLFFMMAFGRMEADLGAEVGPLPELAPLDDAAPAKPAPKKEEKEENE